MPWCPKCKNEYRAGIQICPDCNTELLEELTSETEIEYVPLLQTTDVTMKDKILKYLLHCNIEAKEIIATDSSEQAYTILVPTKDQKEAKIALHTVLSYEIKEQEKEETSEEKEPSNKQPLPVSTLHVNAKDRYQEYKSSGIMLVIFSILLIIFAVLNMTGIITIMASVPSLIVLFAIAAVFLYLGISSLLSVRGLQTEADEEEKSTTALLTYLKENFSKETLIAMEEEGLTDELLYFKQMETMKDALMKYYPLEDENYIDAILEDYYNSLDL